MLFKKKVGFDLVQGEMLLESIISEKKTTAYGLTAKTYILVRTLL